MPTKDITKMTSLNNTVKSKFKNMKNPLVILVIIIFAIFMQSCQNCDLVDVPYTEEEPYTVIEKTDVTLNYNIENNKMYYLRHEGAILFGDNPTMDAYTTVTNTSEYGGTFEFYAYLTSQGDKIEFRTEKYISSGSTETISITKELNPYSFKANVEVANWGVNAPTISVDKEVTKYRTVTKYRKCNPCEEDCGSHHSSKMPSWLIIVIIIGVVGIVAIIIKKIN